MIPRFRPRFTLAEFSGLLGHRSSVSLEDFEREFARVYGFRHAVWFPYGREAIRCSLETLAQVVGVALSREAVVSPFNCVALGNAIVSAGWRPRYVDTAPGSFQAGADAFLSELFADRCGAGIHVAPWGVTTGEAFLKKASKPILHDRCLATLATARPELNRDEDSVAYSFGWGKPLGFLRGGMLCGNSDRFQAGWRDWRATRVKTSASGLSEAKDVSLISIALHPTIFPWSRRAESYSGFRRLSGRDGEESSTPPSDAGRLPSPGHLAALAGRLARIEELRTERREQVEAYFAALGDLPGVALPERSPALSHFPVRTADREALRRGLLARGVFSSDRLFAKLLVDYPGLEGSAADELMNARELTRTTLHLPLYAGLGTAEIAEIGRRVREAYATPRT